SGKALILAGGPHPSGAPDEVLAMGADAVVKGEGEAVLTGLARDILDGKRPGSGIISGQAGQGLDAFPPFSLRWRMFGYIEITRGCPFLCSYCQTPRLFGARQRHRSLENIFSLAARMRAEGLRDIRFLSPDAFAYGSENGRAPVPEKLEALLKGTREAVGADGKIFFGTFPSEVRPEHVDRDTLSLTRRYAANKRLVIGAQSGSPRMLEAIKRGHTVEDVYRAVGLAAGAGFETDVDFIFGLPGETETDAELTLKVIADLTGMGARIHAHTFMPLPQTAFAGKVPAPLSARTEKALRTICSRGQAFGQWEKQRLISGG
ncbi:MAG TPA: TIGR04013 family B12-binding domain/radical SAM domain-containing protein, partial [Elusimicrobiales bacterium]|nr:TIGR04013 family B12-binding domain/radical SAM domain-containing protein [Elusimicrobiales bacterium]